MHFRRPLEQWEDGISSQELIEQFAEQEASIVALPEWRTARLNNYQHLVSALEVVRTQGGQFRRTRDFRGFVKRVLKASEIDEFFVARSRGYVGDDNELPIPASEDGNIHQPSEDDQLELRKQFRNLSLFTALPENLPESVHGFARIVALRVFGGWSLEKIAEHDGEPLAVVTERWSQARAWVRAGEASAIASSTVLTPIEDRVLAAIRDAPQLMRVLEWRPFERLLAKILDSLGYDVELQRGTKDGGVDIVALKHDTALGPHRYLVQAKRSAGRIGVEPVRELLFLKADYQATKACLATTSTFTAGAWQLARDHQWELELKDFAKLQEWLELLRR